MDGKQTVFSGILLLLLLSCSRDRKAAQGIILPSANEVARQFENPPPQYSITFYWGWDGNVTEEVMARDLDEFQSKNVQVVTLEPGYDMGTPYLSPGWFEKVKSAAHLVRERNMRMYLVDEGKYPSGFAGGKFSSEAPELRMKALVRSAAIKVKEHESVIREVPPEVVSAAAYNRTDSTTRVIDIEDGKLNWTAPEGDWQVILAGHEYRTSPTRSVNNPDHGKDRSNSLMDYLDPDAAHRFIEFTHEGYMKTVGEEFGSTILGFRGDEPDYSIRGIPWTTGIFHEFERRKGYDVAPYAASFFSPAESGKQRRIRADYWDVWSSLFAENFFKVQADWCAGHDLKYLVHLNHEDKMIDLVRSEGDFFKDMRTVTLPGVDAIWHQIWPDEQEPVYPKYASSAAHLSGRPRSFTESFAAYRPRPDIDQAKWILDYQLVRGINMVEVMFVPASTRNRSGMRGWLADEKFSSVAGYLHRACYLLSQGQPAADIAVYFPTSSIWLGDKASLDCAIRTMKGLMQVQRDFDVIDDQSLDSILVEENGRFVNLSGQSYAAILVPAATAISKNALTRLRRFEDSGGQVIFLGKAPSLVVDRTFRDATGPADISWGLHEPSAALTETVLDALPQPDFILHEPCKDISYVHRHWKDAELYFIFNEGRVLQHTRITLTGKGKVQIWNAETGRISNVTNTVDAERGIEMELELEPWQTRFVLIRDQ